MNTSFCTVRLLKVALLFCLAACPDDSSPQKYVPSRGDGRADADHHDGDRPPADRAIGDHNPSDALPPHWECKPVYYNTNDGCDCGCGIPDPDCDGMGCVIFGCETAACDYCWQTSDEVTYCAD